MNKRTFAIPVLGATGICLATACGGGEAIEGAWELTELVDGQVIRELPRFTETDDNTYEQFGSIVVAPDLRGALSLITYVNDYYGSRSEFLTGIFEGEETEDRTYALETRGDFNITFSCTVVDDEDGDDRLTCSGQQANLQSASLTARRFADE